jgi:uncharacterized protein YdaL
VKLLAAALLFMMSFFTFPIAADESPKCVQIFYDRLPAAQPAHTYGRRMTGFLENLLAHFPAWDQRVFPIESYRKGQLDDCEASLYVGSDFDNAVPKDFLDDFATTGNRVAWLGYNIWKLGNARLKQIWNVTYQGLSVLDPVHKDPQGMPGFYKFFQYKGETFEKYGKPNALNPNQFDAAFEIVLLQPVDANQTSNVVSWAVHSSTGAKAPYVIKNRRRWYVADLPFSYVTEDDRYLIVSDVLFDILGETPRRTKPIAFFRLEDVHAVVPQWELDAMTSAFTKAGVPFALSVIPQFEDPFLILSQDPGKKAVALDAAPDFVKFLKSIRAKKGTLLMHGYTHQYGTTKNPFNGASGSDYEFWDAVNNKPMADDAPPWVMNRLETGFAMMEKAGVAPTAWLTPHYGASALDNVIFGEVFDWTVGRNNYTRAVASQASSVPDTQTFEGAGSAGRAQRLAHLADLSLAYPEGDSLDGQFFPYEIYGDLYGQRVIPEDIGYLQPAVSQGSVQVTLVDDFLKRLKRNRVLRDVWGSFFVHPYLVNTAENGGLGKFQGDASEILRLLQSTKDLGYEFIDLKAWLKTNGKAKRRPTVEGTMPKPAH